MHAMNKAKQQGVMLIEALIAILIFSLGILGMVAMGSVAIAAQSDSQYRTEAANYANEIVSEMAVELQKGVYNQAAGGFAPNVALLTFSHQTVSGGYCSFAGAPSANVAVTDWVNRIAGGVDPKRALPGATAISQQILVNQTPGSGFNQVTVTICWQPPSSAAVAFAPMHRYVLVSYVN
jgi:type IV pilus assembly protein PilV